MSRSARFVLVVTASLAAAACGSGQNDDRTLHRSGRRSGDAHAPYVADSPAEPDVDVARVVEVSSDKYPERTYFYDSSDSAHVYWFDASNPGVWSYRPFYRDGDRAYFLERDGAGVRRIDFDDRRARRLDWDRDARWSASERATLRKAARDEWIRQEIDERDWRRRWESRNAYELAGRRADEAAARRNVDVNIDSVVDVRAESYPGRTYFYDPADAAHVYWFDASSPGSWTYRPLYRDGGRAYVLERDGSSLKRVYFDDRKAREFDLDKDARWTIADRGRLRTAARADWIRGRTDEEGWRNKWDAKLRMDERTANEKVNIDAVADVSADSTPDRTYFFDAGDEGHVYWFDGSNPHAWNYRPVYRDGTRAYFLDREGATVRRVFFDDRRAKAFDWNAEKRWNPEQRDRLRSAAREEWSRRERDEGAWRGRWIERHPADRR